MTIIAGRSPNVIPLFTGSTAPKSKLGDNKEIRRNEDTSKHPISER